MGCRGIAIFFFFLHFSFEGALKMYILKILIKRISPSLITHVFYYGNFQTLTSAGRTSIIKFVASITEFQYDSKFVESILFPTAFFGGGW